MGREERKDRAQAAAHRSQTRVIRAAGGHLGSLIIAPWLITRAKAACPTPSWRLNKMRNRPPNRKRLCEYPPPLMTAYSTPRGSVMQAGELY
jgi:hypothetical protein